MTYFVTPGDPRIYHGNGQDGEPRTRGHLIKGQVLYQLSYILKYYGGQSWSCTNDVSIVTALQAVASLLGISTHIG